MRDNTSTQGCIVYEQHPWGDYIMGVKEQLQPLGLAIGRAYPGEPGGPALALHVIDKHGHRVGICQADRNPELFTAYRRFRDWPQQPDQIGATETDAHGVALTRTEWGDIYKGTAAALAAAGVVRPECLPGAPGMPKATSVLLPDGTPGAGRMARSSAAAKAPGARLVEKAGRDRYSVFVRLDSLERARRGAAIKDLRAAWEARVSRLPRPPMLAPMPMRQWEQLERAEAAAARDGQFQRMLASLAKPAAGQLAPWQASA